MGHASQQARTQSMDTRGVGAASECLPTQVPTKLVSADILCSIVSECSHTQTPFWHRADSRQLSLKPLLVYIVIM